MNMWIRRAILEPVTVVFGGNAGRSKCTVRVGEVDIVSARRGRKKGDDERNIRP